MDIVKNINPGEYLKFLSDPNNTIPNGSFVSIGYFNDHKIGKKEEDIKDKEGNVIKKAQKKDFEWGEKTKKRITEKNDAELSAYIEKLPSCKFKDALIAFQKSEKYQNALAAGKTAPFNIDGDVHILMVSRHIVNWKDRDSFVKFYKDRGDEEVKVRAKHGFGYADDTYDENDWRRKSTYKGTGIHPVSKGGGNIYRPIGNTSFYGVPYTAKEADEYNKKNNLKVGDPGYKKEGDFMDRWAIRQISNPAATAATQIKPIWLFIDADGIITELDSELIAWLQYAYKSPRPKKEVAEMSQEEKDFVNDLHSIKNYDRHELTMIMDNTLYITGTAVDKVTKDKTSFTWTNYDNVLKVFPYITRKKLENIFKRCQRKSKDEVIDLNESFKIKFSNKLNESKINNKKSKKALYENIMREVSKIVKKHLNESVIDDRKTIMYRSNR